MFLTVPNPFRTLYVADWCVDSSTADTWNIASCQWPLAHIMVSRLMYKSLCVRWCVSLLCSLTLKTCLGRLVDDEL